MKSFCCFVAIAVCLGTTGVASAGSVGFSMNILDPLTGGVAETTNSFQIIFTQCSTFSNESEFPTDITAAGTAADYGCFEGVNASSLANDPDDWYGGKYHPDSDDSKDGTTWTSLDMTFSNNSFLAGQTPSCGGIDSGDSIFSAASTTCSYNSTAQLYTLDFSGGSIAPGESFLIVEYTAGTPQFTQGNTDSLFGAGTATVSTGVPEPNAALLLATGGAIFGLLLYAERRGLLRPSTRS